MEHFKTWCKQIWTNVDNICKAQTGEKDFKSVIFTQPYTESYRLHLPQLKKKDIKYFPKRYEDIQITH